MLCRLESRRNGRQECLRYVRRSFPALGAKSNILTHSKYNYSDSIGILPVLLFLASISETLVASPTAANGNRFPQRTLQMKSQERPSATSSSTCQTIMRVPLNVGFPWQIVGSTTMYWPSSSRCDERFLVLPVFMFTIYRENTLTSSRFLVAINEVKKTFQPEFSSITAKEFAISFAIQ